MAWPGQAELSCCCAPRISCQTSEAAASNPSLLRSSLACCTSRARLQAPSLLPSCLSDLAPAHVVTGAAWSPSSSWFLQHRGASPSSLRCFLVPHRASGAMQGGSSSPPRLSDKDYRCLWDSLQHQENHVCTRQVRRGAWACKRPTSSRAQNKTSPCISVPPTTAPQTLQPLLATTPLACLLCSASSSNFLATCSTAARAARPMCATRTATSASFM